MKVDDLKTGDILLFNEHPSSCCFSHFTKCIKSCTSSNYSHCAYVIKNRFRLKGTYVWESSFHEGSIDPSDKKKNKFGVQLTPIDFYLNRYPGTVDIFVRKRVNTDTNKICKYKLNTIRKVVRDKPYDINPCDWVCAKFRCGPRKTTSRFWCSALLAYILRYLGDISDCDWSEVRAQDFSVTAKNRPFCWITTYEPETKLIKRTSII